MASNAVGEGVDGRLRQWAWAFWHPSFEVELRAAALAPLEEPLDYTKIFNAVREAAPMAEEPSGVEAASAPGRRKGSPRI